MLEATQESSEDWQLMTMVPGSLIAPVANIDFEAQMPSYVHVASGIRDFWLPKKIDLRMTKAEVDLFTTILKTNSKSPYLEFGAGGSTLLAAGIMQQVFSVENDASYIRLMRRKLWSLPARKNVKLFHIDQGPTEEWGYPITTDDNTLRLYAETVWRDHQIPSSIKTILVDGRFRRACLLHSILHIDDDVDILLHDADRHEDIVQDFFVELRLSDNLSHLQKRSDVGNLRIVDKLSLIELHKT